MPLIDVDDDMIVTIFSLQFCGCHLESNDASRLFAMIRSKRHGEFRRLRGLLLGSLEKAPSIGL